MTARADPISAGLPGPCGEHAARWDSRCHWLRLGEYDVSDTGHKQRNHLESIRDTIRSYFAVHIIGQAVIHACHHPAKEGVRNRSITSPPFLLLSSRLASTTDSFWLYRSAAVSAFIARSGRRIVSPDTGQFFALQHLFLVFSPPPRSPRMSCVAPSSVHPVGLSVRAGRQ